MRVGGVLAALLLTQCGAPPEIKLAPQWQATQDPCRHVYKLVVETGDGAVVEAAGRRMIATPFVEGDGRPRATLTWQERELAASRVLLVRVTHGSIVREIEHQVAALPPGVAVPLPTDRAGPSLPVSARVEIVEAAGVRKGPKIAVSMDSGRLRFDIPTCRVGEATAGIGSAEVRDMTVRYSLPVRDALKLTRSSQAEEPAATLPLSLHNPAGKTDVQVHVALDALAHVAFRELPAKVYPDFPVHQKGNGVLMVMYAGHPANSPRAVRLVAPKGHASGEVTAVAIGHLSLFTAGQCRYAYLLDPLIAKRVRRDFEVVAYEAKSGRVLGSRRFEGKMPPQCPEKMLAKVTGGQAALEESLHGQEPSDTELVTWLERF